MNAALFMDDPAWADCVPDRKSGGAKCGLPAHDDCSPLDPDETARPLEPGGSLGLGMAGYESRPGQVEMLRAVVRAFNERSHLMVEAGTGVGKSLAYLVPAVRWAKVNDTPVVVSTATRNLQSQLVAKDIPRAVSALGDDAASFRVAVLKGRGNYLCLRELAEVMRDGYYALSPDERAEMDALVAWLPTTSSGDLDEFGGVALRPRLFCGGEDCAGRRCAYYGKCFVQKARERAQRAHLVVANHALVMAEASSPGSGILPAYGRLVFDEAHNLEDVATDFLSFEFSRASLARLLGKFERKAKGRRAGPDRTKGFVGAVSRQLQRGALADSAVAERVRELLTKARLAANLAVASADALFDVLARLFSPAPHDADRIRFRVVDGVRQFALHGLFAAYTPAQWDEQTLAFAALDFEDRLARVVEAVAAVGRALADSAADGELQMFGDLVAQAESLAETFREFLLETKAVLAAGDPDSVYWAERGGRGGVAVKSSPLSVAAEMKRMFWDVKDTVVLCSATLRSGNSFSYAAKKLGFDLVEPGRAKTLLAASPFDYLRQSLVLAPAFLPDPASSGAACVNALAPFLRDLFVATRGRALALFTSYDMMRAVADAARPLFDLAGLRLIVQGDGGLSREAMVRELKDAHECSSVGVLECSNEESHSSHQSNNSNTPTLKHSNTLPTVLFGAQSFWEGVDVPGDALGCVVIARLPFPQAGEPIVEARSDKIEADGGSSFRDYMLPEAVVRFRQGFGRLVRTKSDRGIVVVADSRVVTKNYGASFRRALPTSVHTVTTPDEFRSRVEEFLRGG